MGLKTRTEATGMHGPLRWPVVRPWLYIPSRRRQTQRSLKDEADGKSSVEEGIMALYLFLDVQELY
jgi:hypothetical protein